MKMNKLFEVIDLAFNSTVTPALVGTSGVGKTSIAREYGKARGFDVVIILRPSLVADVADLVGLPDFEVLTYGVGKNKTEVKRTTFRSPKWLPLPNQKALVVVDELNRTHKDIIMAMFDLIEAEHPKIGEYVLPKGSKVIATLNPPTDNYQVLDLKDSAFVSRLMFIKVVPDFESFNKWGKETGEVTDLTLNFFRKNEKFFGTGDSKGEAFEVEDFGLNIRDNNRSKKKVSDLERVATQDKVSDEVLFEAIRGIGGIEFATQFMQFRKNNSIITAKDIIDDRSKLEQFDFEALSNVSKVLEDVNVMLTKGVEGNNEVFTDNQLLNLSLFLEKIPLDTLNGFVMSAIEVTETTSEQEEDLRNDFGNRILDIDPKGGLLGRINETKKYMKEKEEKETAKA